MRLVAYAEYINFTPDEVSAYAEYISLTLDKLFAYAEHVQIQDTSVKGDWDSLASHLNLYVK